MSTSKKLKPDTLVKIATALDQAEFDIASFQDTYFATNKRYWQGIKTPDVPTKEGADKAIDLTRKPTDQVADWSGVLSTITQPCAIEVHTHDGPDGKGYTIYTTSIAEDDSAWVKADGVGSHSTSFDWVEAKSLTPDK